LQFCGAFQKAFWVVGHCHESRQNEKDVRWQKNGKKAIRRKSGNAFKTVRINSGQYELQRCEEYVNPEQCFMVDGTFRSQRDVFPKNTDGEKEEQE